MVLPRHIKKNSPATDLSQGLTPVAVIKRPAIVLSPNRVSSWHKYSKPLTKFRLQEFEREEVKWDDFLDVV